MAILVRAIIEMLGKPKEHIEDTLKKYVQKLRDDKIKIKKEKFAQAQPNGDYFSTFSELEIEFANISEIMNFCITSLPSSIEIISPDTLMIDSPDMTGAFVDLQGHLHDIDMLIKNLRAQLEILDKNAVALLRNFVVHHVSHQAMALTDLAGVLGIKEKDLKPFLDRMIEAHLIREEDGKYASTD